MNQKKKKKIEPKKMENSDHQGLLRSSLKVTSLSDLTSMLLHDKQQLPWDLCSFMTNSNNHVMRFVLLCDKQQPPRDESEGEGGSVSE